MNKIQISHKFKKIGWILFILSFVSIFIIAINVTNDDFTKPLLLITKYGILIGLLIVSISKESMEDEFIKNIRMQSYMVAFLIGVLQTLISPFINLAVGELMNGTSFMNFPNDFIILWTLLIYQIIVFNVLKWRADE